MFSATGNVIFFFRVPMQIPEKDLEMGLPALFNRLKACEKVLKHGCTAERKLLVTLVSKLTNQFTCNLLICPEISWGFSTDIEHKSRFNLREHAHAYIYIYIIDLLLIGDVSLRRSNKDLVKFHSHFLFARISSGRIMNASRCEECLKTIFLFMATLRIASLKYRDIVMKLELINNSVLCWGQFNLFWK